MLTCVPYKNKLNEEYENEEKKLGTFDDCVERKSYSLFFNQRMEEEFEDKAKIKIGDKM